MTTSESSMIRLGGSGQPIVLLHGFGADRLTWLGITPALTKLGTVWALELPGHGEAWESPAADCIATLATTLSSAIFFNTDTPVHLVGHSLGGGLMMLCANSAPEHVASISLLAPAGFGYGANAEFLKRFPLLTDADATLELLRTCVFNPGLISDQIAPMLLPQLAREGVRKSLQACASVILGSEDEFEHARDKIAAADLPRQVIWGLQDTITPLKQTDEAAFGGRWHMLDQCGHLPHIEHRAAVSQHLASFIKYNSDLPN